jgi:hypothetical protein
MFLHAEGEEYDEDEVVEGLKQIANAGLGLMHWDDEAEQFYLAWTQLPSVALEILRTGQSLSTVSPNLESTGDSQSMAFRTEPLQKYRFKLRQDCSVGLELPDNLSNLEARKIYKFLKALALSVPAWPFPSTSKFDGRGEPRLPIGQFDDDEFLDDEADEFLKEFE